MNSPRIEIARLALQCLRPSERRWLLQEFVEAPRAPTQKASPERPILMTQAEAARLLGVSRQTMFRWARTGVVSPVVISGVRRFRRTDLEQLARAGTGGVS